MPIRHAEYLARCLQGGSLILGQIQVSPDFRLCHVEDVGQSSLTIFTAPDAAVEIARFDDAGVYRPLKTAPNLRHGWRLELSSPDEALQALNFLYPAAIGTLLAQESGKLTATPLRETLSRQTGMYAVVKKITDEEADQLIDELCRRGCLRRRLWSVAGETSDGETKIKARELPLWCAEACNLYIAAGRKLVKKKD